MPQQVGIIAVRRRGESLRICLMRRKRSKAWAIPKGFIDRGATPQEAALNEAWEEVGLSGEILGGPVGKYVYSKYDSRLTVAVFVMKVRTAHRSWDEMDYRERAWVSPKDARALLADHPVRPLLTVALRQFQRRDRPHVRRKRTSSRR
jgi:8-oxo-dGTP pyrophosphatase MutT (NUDIX family)